MTRTPEPRPAPTSRTEGQAPAPVVEKPAFERPELHKRGTLPKVTTAFGGSFLP